MVHIHTKETDTVIDIERIVNPSNELDIRISIDGSACNENAKNCAKPDLEKKNKKDKSLSAKKPPRPPRGLSLDASDRKFIKEISELAMIKRARIERIKALRKMKAAKAQAGSTSSSGNYIAMLFTVLFCIVMVFQGCHSSGMSRRNSSFVIVHASPELNETVDENIVNNIQEKLYLSSANAPLIGA